MRTKRWATVVFLFIVTCATSGPAASGEEAPQSPQAAGDSRGEEYLLRFKPAPDSQVQVSQEIEQDILIELGEMGTQEMRSEMLIKSTQKVLSGKAAGITRIELVMDRVSMVTRQGDSVVLSYDTAESSDDDEVGKALNMMVGKSFAVEFSERGEIESVGGFDEIWSQIEGDIAPEVRPMLEGLKQSFNEESLRQMMQASMPVFPNEPVAIGQSWDHSADLSHPLFGTMQMDTTFTAAGVEEAAGESCLELAVESNMKLNFDSEMLNQLTAASGGEMKMEVDDILSSGTMCVALADGLPIAAEIRQQIRMTMEIAMPDKEPQQMSMAMNQIVRQSVER